MPRGNVSDYLVHKLLEHEVGKNSYAMPTSYLGASTTVPNNDGTNITEPANGGYARIQTAGADWNAAATRKITNANELAFPQATADWNEIVALVEMDADSGGNMLRWGRLGKVYTTLAEELTETDTTITVADASSMPAAGTVIIEDEIITYTGKDVNNLTGCTRGAGGSTARAHAQGHDVFSCLPRTVLATDILRFTAGELELKYFS